jgi:hypothetical protein
VVRVEARLGSAVVVISDWGKVEKVEKVGLVSKIKVAAQGGGSVGTGVPRLPPMSNGGNVLSRS